MTSGHKRRNNGHSSIYTFIRVYRKQPLEINSFDGMSMSFHEDNISPTVKALPKIASKTSEKKSQSTF